MGLVRTTCTTPFSAFSVSTPLFDIKLYNNIKLGEPSGKVPVGMPIPCNNSIVFIVAL